MSHVLTTENWTFEITGLKARKTKRFGEEFEAVGDISIVDGQLHVQGLLATEKFSTRDFKEITSIVKQLGFDRYYRSTFENGERKLIEVKIGRVS